MLDCVQDGTQAQLQHNQLTCGSELLNMLIQVRFYPAMVHVHFCGHCSFADASTLDYAQHGFL